MFLRRRLCRVRVEVVEHGEIGLWMGMGMLGGGEEGALVGRGRVDVYFFRSILVGGRVNLAARLSSDLLWLLL